MFINFKRIINIVDKADIAEAISAHFYTGHVLCNYPDTG